MDFKKCHIVSEETKRKLSEVQKGRMFSGETRRNMSKANKGGNNPNYGKSHLEETLRKIG